MLDVTSPQQRDRRVSSCRSRRLIDDDTLKLGQGKSLVGKLELALYMLEWGNTKKAITMLEAFIQEVEAFERGGILNRRLADEFIAAAQAAIDVLSRAEAASRPRQEGLRPRPEAAVEGPRRLRTRRAARAAV